MKRIIVASSASFVVRVLIRVAATRSLMPVGGFATEKITTGSPGRSSDVIGRDHAELTKRAATANIAFTVDADRECSSL